MAILDSSMYYTMALGVILAIIYALPNIYFRAISTKHDFFLGKSQKGELYKEVISIETVGAETVTPTPKRSPDWWKDEDIFQLERRAIFSKVPPRAVNTFVLL